MWNPYGGNIHIHKVATKFATTQNKCVCVCVCVCSLFLHSALHEGSQNSVLFHKTYQNTGKPVILCGSKGSSYAAYLADDADVPICCARGTFFLEDSTLVPFMLSLPSVSRSPTGCPDVKNLSHILVICSSVMNRQIRKLRTEFETSYRNCIVWYNVPKKKKNTMPPWDPHTDCGSCKQSWYPLSNNECGREPVRWAGMY